MRKPNVLIIDDEGGIRKSLADVLEDEKYRVFTAEDAVCGLEILAREDIGIVFLDVLMPRMGGIDALELIRRNHKKNEVIMISGHANIDVAVRAVKLGAYDFLEKPLSLEKVLTVCRNVAEILHLREENQKLSTLKYNDEFVGSSAEMEKVRDLIKQAASSEAKILISGENGSGKELAARAIHRLSSRAAKPFVEVNCAAIPDTLIESELFGHEKGAFTDAISLRKGRFETATGGTLFLDEIGDMSMQAQAKVLRAIQDQKIERLGGEKTISVDVRIVAATNKDLEQLCREGKFRDDLFFRLNVIPLRIPPLRERKSDIPVLLTHFLEEFNAQKPEISPEVLDFLSAYSWPGNVRELKNFSQRIAVIYGDRHVGLKEVSELLNESGLKNTGATSVPHFPVEKVMGMTFSQAKDFFEKYFLEYKLFQNNGIITHAAEAIGIYPSNLHAKMKKHGL